MRKWFSLLAMALIATSDLGATVFQYTVPAETSKKTAEAFMWVPPDAPMVRGVILGGMTSAEREIVKDPEIRAACEKEDLAIVFLTCGLGQANIEKVLKDFASVSGYSELPMAPLMFIGHSAGGPQAKRRAIQYADRCFGLMQTRGGTPGPAEPVPAGVPTLTMTGQFDEFGGLMRSEEGGEPWQRARADVEAHRSSDPAHLASLVVEPGAGHFSWSNRNSDILALFIEKAAAARIPDWSPDATAPVKCKTIDPASGWLTDLAIEVADSNSPAPAAEYAGDKSKAAWHFDEEMAKAVAAYHAGGFGKKDQFITWEDRVAVEAGSRNFFQEIKWTDDGQTFEVHPIYRETYPEPQKDGGPRWLEAGKPIGHSTAPIQVKHVGGPAEIAGPNKLRIKYDGLAPASGSRGRITFMAFSEGDDDFRYTEFVGMLPRDFKGLTKGREQTITFPKLSDMKVGDAPVELKATSDSGLPVEYYVAHGPAEVVDGKLALTDIPSRSNFPIELKVVAWQFGSAVDPLVKSAAPVEQVIQLTK